MPKGYTGPIDLSNARASSQTTVRQGTDLSQYEAILKDSWNRQQSSPEDRGIVEIPIPTDARKTVESRLRQAAKAIDLGVATGERADTEKALQAGFMWLLVQARTRKAAPNTASSKPKGETKKGLPPVAAAS